MKKYTKQGVASDVSSIEGALAQTAQSEVNRIIPKKLAQGEPKRVKGYEGLGKGLKHIPKDNRGDGA